MKDFYDYRDDDKRANRQAKGIQIKDFVASIPLYPPSKLYQELEALGYRGQEKARKAACLGAYRHVKKLKLLHEKRVSRESLPPRYNYIFVGPTGCGKTYLIELLFGEILKLPFVIVDMTKFSETGYVGDDVINILVQLIYAARGYLEIAECGVVALDEFDKIAGSNSNLRFAGQGTTKDVSGYGVQRELLKLLEGSDIQVPLDYGFSHRGPRTLISTRDITFFGIGAFSGLKEVKSETDIGFMKKISKRSKSKIAYRIESEEIEDISRFYTYGFLPELIARFQRIIPFQPLDEATLKDILDIKLNNYIKEFQEEGFEIVFEPEVSEFIVKDAIRRETGARGLDSAIAKIMEDVAFQFFGTNNSGRIIITCKDNEIKPKIELRA